MPAIRRGETGDLESVGAIQAVCPEAARWQPADYLQYDFRVAICTNRVAGFAVSRETGPGEREILNLAVAPEFRRRGAGRRLVEAILKGFQGSVFLEVRESNRAARNFYKSLSFVEISRREGYYRDPPEAGIVMKFHSC
jgi:ribosomal-protein-alanine N-acetyltransferase